MVLDGTVTDDGQPNPPGGVRTRWSKLSGLGMVNFADPSAVDTVVRFARPGTYVLRLAADDGILTNSDELVITVLSPNLAPLVIAMPGQEVLLGTPVTLRGAVTDDSLPNPPGQFGTVWSVVNGPGTVTFGNASAVETTAQFSKAGMYRLRLTANDGERVGWQDVKIKVKKPLVIKPPKPHGSQFGGSQFDGRQFDG